MELFRIFIANLDRYEACTDERKTLHDFGEWFDLPIEKNRLGAVICERIGSSSVNGYEVVETETAFDELAYSSSEIWQANLDAEKLEHYALSDEDMFVVNAWLAQSYDLEDALDKVGRCTVYADCEDEVELGKAVAEEEGLECDYELEDYIRWEDFVYDRFHGDYIFYEYSCIVYR